MSGGGRWGWWAGWGWRASVGIGFAGMLRGWTGVVANAPNFGWREVDFRGLLRAALGPAVERRRTTVSGRSNIIRFVNGYGLATSTR